MLDACLRRHDKSCSVSLSKIEVRRWDIGQCCTYYLKLQVFAVLPHGQTVGFRSVFRTFGSCIITEVLTYPAFGGRMRVV